MASRYYRCLHVETQGKLTASSQRASQCCRESSEQCDEQLRESEQFSVEVVSPEMPSRTSEPPDSERPVGSSPRFMVRARLT